MDVSCISCVIILNLTCNVATFLFIFTKKKDKRTFKDEIVAALCLANAGQAVGYMVELCAAVEGPSSCEVSTVTFVSLRNFILI